MHAANTQGRRSSGKGTAGCGNDLLLTSGEVGDVEIRRIQ